MPCTSCGACFPERLLTLAHVPIGEEGALEELERSAALGVAGVYSIVHLSRKGVVAGQSRPKLIFRTGQ